MGRCAAVPSLRRAATIARSIDGTECMKKGSVNTPAAERGMQREGVSVASTGSRSESNRRAVFAVMQDVSFSSIVTLRLLSMEASGKPYSSPDEYALGDEDETEEDFEEDGEGEWEVEAVVGRKTEKVRKSTICRQN